MNYCPRTTTLSPGDRCIIHVSEVNRPTGWWWGVVDTVTRYEVAAYTRVVAHITGPFAFAPGDFGDKPPIYGEANIPLGCDYYAFPDTDDTRTLVRWLLRAEKERDISRAALRESRESLRLIGVGIGSGREG